MKTKRFGNSSGFKFTLALGTCLLGAATGLPQLAHAGGETGHGNGGWYKGHIRHEKATEWCSELGSMVEDAYDDVKDANTLTDKRDSLVGSIQYIIGAYDAGDLPYQPLTYSLLKMALDLNEKFPAHTDLGDQAGAIVLDKLLETARTVNREFDLPKFVPVQEAFNKCHHFHCRDGAADKDSNEVASEFYTAYLSAAKAVLNTLFQQAVPGINANVLQSMAYDRWELDASLEVLGYLSASLKQDLFGRYLGCMKNRVDYISAKLTAYLDSTPATPLQDRKRREKIEGQFAQIREELAAVTNNSGHWSCEYHH